jgi:hypothetical protein
MTTLGELCGSYRELYNSERPHQGISGKIPDRAPEDSITMPYPKKLKTEKTQKLGGLVTHFCLAA